MLIRCEWFVGIMVFITAIIPDGIWLATENKEIFAPRGSRFTNRGHLPEYLSSGLQSEEKHRRRLERPGPKVVAGVKLVDGEKSPRRQQLLADLAWFSDAKTGDDDAAAGDSDFLSGLEALQKLAAHTITIMLKIILFMAIMNQEGPLGHNLGPDRRDFDGEQED